MCKFKEGDVVVSIENHGQLKKGCLYTVKGVVARRFLQVEDMEGRHVGGWLSSRFVLTGIDLENE
jgi:hypothetical protein